MTGLGSKLKLLGYLATLRDVETLRRLKEDSPIDEGQPWYTFIDPTGLQPLGQVQFEAENDGHTCDICGEYDGDYYDFLDDSKPIPPLHPHCRCVYRYVPSGEVVDFSEQADFYR